MIFKIEDLVFQNDRYFLLLGGKEAENLATVNCLDIYADNIKVKRLSGCHVSEILSIPHFTVLESQENLSDLDWVFRKTKLTEICTCDKKVNYK